jgi:STE24 endopeptidase
MENLYYLIIITAIIVEYLLSSVSSFLDIKNITPIIPQDFKKAYDEKKYVRSQEYLKARTRFGLFSSTFSLCLILIVIHSDIFGVLDQYVRIQTENYILQGLMFIGVIYIFQDIISLPFSLYNTFVIEQKFGFNKTTLGLFIIDKIKGYAIFIVLGSLVITPLLYFFHVYSEIGWLSFLLSLPLSQPMVF